VWLRRPCLLAGPAALLLSHPGGSWRCVPASKGHSCGAASSGAGWVCLTRRKDICSLRTPPLPAPAPTQTMLLRRLKEQLDAAELQQEPQLPGDADEVRTRAATRHAPRWHNQSPPLCTWRCSCYALPCWPSRQLQQPLGGSSQRACAASHRRLPCCRLLHLLAPTPALPRLGQPPPTPALLPPAPAGPQEQRAQHEAALEQYRVAAAGGMQQQQLVRWYLEALVERWEAPGADARGAGHAAHQPWPQAARSARPRQRLRGRGWVQARRLRAPRRMPLGPAPHMQRDPTSSTLAPLRP
jgi:hypothetical protein